MKLSPVDLVRRRLIRRAVLSCVKFGEGIYFIGFDWEPHVAAVGSNVNPKARVIAAVTRHFCWRALIRVRHHGDRPIAVVLDIGGDVTYGLAVRQTERKYAAVWTRPDPLCATELLELHEHNW